MRSFTFCGVTLTLTLALAGLAEAQVLTADVRLPAVGPALAAPRGIPRFPSAMPAPRIGIQRRAAGSSAFGIDGWPRTELMAFTEVTEPPDRAGAELYADGKLSLASPGAGRIFHSGAPGGSTARPDVSLAIALAQFAEAAPASTGYTAIPEPGLYAAVLAAGVFAFVAVRRLRR